MTSLTPYNITLNTQCSNFQFQPQRDGPIDQGWNVTYSRSNDSTYDLGNGMGYSSHRTSLPGAFVELDWSGTAIYVFGNALPSSVYNVTVDGAPVNGAPDLSQGLLGSATGLVYGEHTLHVATGDSNLFSVSGAVLTIGVGSDRDTVTNQTLTMVTPGIAGAIGTFTLNPFFTYQSTGAGAGTWFIGMPDTTFTPDGALVNLLPQVITKVNGDSFSFTLNQTSAFFVYGSLAWDHDSFTATITQIPIGVVVKQGTYSHLSRWAELDAILYFGAGLDPSKSYEIAIRNVGVGKVFGVRSLDLIQVARPAGAANATRTGLSTRAAIGVAIGALVGSLLLAIALFYVWRSRSKSKSRRRRDEPVSPETAQAPESERVSRFTVTPFSQDLSPSTDPSSPPTALKHPPNTAQNSMLSAPATGMAGPQASGSASAAVPAHAPEIDAGRVPSVSVPPPGYNPAWQTEA